MRLIVVLLVLLPFLARAQNITRQALVPLSNYVAQVSAQSMRSSNGFATNATFYGLTNEGYTRILGDFNATGIALLSGDAIITDLTVSGSSLFVGPISIGAFDFTIGHLDNWSALPTGAMANAVSATFLSNQVSAAATSILFSSNYLQGLISVGGATLSDVTNISTQVTSLASNALRTDIENLQGTTNGLRTDVLNLQGATNGLASGITTTSNIFRTDIGDLQTGTNAITAKLDSNIWWLVWGSLGSNSISGKLDSNVWWNAWGSIATNALTAKASQTDLTGASNALVSLIGGGTTDWSVFASTTNAVGVSNWVNSVSNFVTASGAIVSNGAVAFTMTASNTLRTAFAANDTTTSNALRTAFIANDTTTSNGVVSLLVAGDTTTSNFLFTLISGLGGGETDWLTVASTTNVVGVSNWVNSVSNYVTSASTTTSNALRTTFIANDTTTSNGVVTLLVANDTFTSNALNTAIIAATNAAQVTNWINFRQPASDNLTNWSLIATGALTGKLQSNATMALINLSVSNLVATNIASQAGMSTSNFVMQGQFFFSTGLFTNLNALSTLSNLANVSIPGHTLTNNGDSIEGEWHIKMANTVVNTNQFQIIYGSQTILDTGLQIASNTQVYAWCKIVRTGSTSQRAFGHLEWGPSLVPFAFTNTNLELVQTNGIATVLKMMGGARRLGAHTNNLFQVTYVTAAR